MAKDVIIALDFPGEPEVFRFLERFGEERPYVKVGIELFYSAGADMVRELKRQGFRVFLDLKLHDIPNTVGRAMASLAKLGADMVNLHASGGSVMMRAAIDALSDASGTRPVLIAVTQLTSTDSTMLRDELLIGSAIEETVLRYAENAAKSGLDGVVCSPLEAESVKRVCGESFLTVTPGIRFAGTDTQDQARVTTPFRARELGSDYIVVGRPITEAESPLEAYRRCVSGFIDGQVNGEV